MGKKKKPTIGYWHQMGLYMGHSFTIDALRAIKVGGEMAWTGNQTESGEIFINQPNLFGGEKKEGGIVGTFTARMGEATQQPHPYLEEQVPGPWPAARGLFTSLFNGRVGAMSLYVKPWSVMVSRWTAGWRTPVWQPDLAKIGEGMNAAHIIYQVLTDPDATIGLGTASVDEAGMLAAAQQLFNEQLGLCLKWRKSEPVRNFMAKVCEHVAGQLSVDPRTNTVRLALFRDDYDPETLADIDETNIVSLESWEVPSLDNSTNEITVVGRDCLTNKDISATYQNLGAVQAQGRVISEKRELPGLWNQELVARVAAREAHVSSSLLQRIKVRLKATEWGIKVGDVRALSWGRRGVVRMPVRVIEVDEGTPTDSSIGVTLLQDVFGLPATTYLGEAVSQWQPPNTTPQPVAAQRIYEATYRDLAGNLSSAELAALQPETGYLVALGAEPSGATITGFELHTRVGATEYRRVTTGDFSATGLLANPIGRTATVIQLSSFRKLSLVEVGSEALCNGEFWRVDAIDEIAGEVTIGRGCVDTVPVAHAAGSRVWFTDTYNGADPTEYLDGEEVDAKLLTITSKGALDLGAATEISVTMAGRQVRPYPPGQVLVGGVAEPATVDGAIAVSWAHRDRVLQADQLVDTTAGSIGPEQSARYGLRFLDDLGALIIEKLDVAGDSASAILNYTGDVTMQLYAISDHGESLQRHERTFAYTPPPGTTESTITADTYEPTEIIFDGGAP